MIGGRHITKTASIGRTLYTATGQEVKEHGVVSIKGVTAGWESQLQLHVVDGLTKPLLSANDLVSHGCRVVFDQDAYGNDISVITHKKSGKQIPTIHRNGIWDLEFALNENDDDFGPVPPLCPFTRRAPRMRTL
jgi:hypothetical protein